MLQQANRPYAECGFCGEHRMHFSDAFDMEGNLKAACRGCCMEQERLRIKEGDQRRLVHAYLKMGMHKEAAEEIADIGIGSTRWQHVWHGPPAAPCPLWLHVLDEGPWTRGCWNGTTYTDQEGKVVDACWWMLPTDDDLREKAKFWRLPSHRMTT